MKILSGRAFRLAAVAIILASPHLFAQAADEPLSEAKTCFQRGLEAYDARDYAEALKSFERSYALSHRPEILFDIAETHVALGDCAGAVHKLDELVQQGKQSPALVERADARRRELLPCANRATPQPLPSPESSSAPPVVAASTVSRPFNANDLAAPAAQMDDAAVIASRPGRPHAAVWTAVSWGAAGASAASAVAGVVLGVKAHASEQNVESATIWGADQDREDARGRAYGAAGAALFVTAAVAAAASVVAYVIGRRQPERPR